MPLDHQRIKALFLSAHDLADPADRLAFLDRECGADDELRRRVDGLLAAADRPDLLLQGPLVAEETAADFALGSAPSVAPDTTIGLSDHGAIVAGDAPVPDGATVGFSTVGARPEPFPVPVNVAIGTLVAGRYKLRQAIGEGGMGTVYLAEQVQPVRRQVALKLIRAGMDSRTVLARFESERQALAIMDHPNIARVLDAGTTDSGHPFFVMDLVKGISLTDYCDTHRLDLPTRLNLFRQICGAVQHAHQKGVIHRDLKPTNILVESHDGAPVPKVIDFGLAKATSGLSLTEASLFTAFGTIAGTPLYMAPEQAMFNALDVDTRADIYALGVILYELLTGSTPIRKESLQRAALDEVLRVIREDEPPMPSSRISTSEALPSVAATRQVEPVRLGRYVRGDLDWIVMKALAKERSRRYDSAIGMANDVERFLNDEPVTAGPPTARYRTAKFIRRHRGQVVAATFVLLTLVIGAIGTTLGLVEAMKQTAAKEKALVAESEQRRLTVRQKREAQRQAAIARAETTEREKARRAEAEQRLQAEKRLAQNERISGILGSIFQDLNPRSADKEGKPLAALLGERLDQTAAALDGESIGDPLALARMQRTLGLSQLGLGYPQKATGLFIRCRETFSSILGPDHPDTLYSMNSLANAYQLGGQPQRALPLWEQTLAMQKTKLGPDHPDTLRAMENLSRTYRLAGKPDQARPLNRKLADLWKRREGTNGASYANALTFLGTDLLELEKWDEAESVSREALAIRGRSKDDS